jgi:hypothetical protein
VKESSLVEFLKRCAKMNSGRYFQDINLLKPSGNFTCHQV